MTSQPLQVLTLRDPKTYPLVHQQMKYQVAQHHQDTVWFLQHLPIVTVGVRTPPSDVAHSSTPILITDRGGLATYHAPGQWVGYVMMNLQQRQISIIDLVHRIEQYLIVCLQQMNIDAHLIPQDRGVYVHNRKIASVGLRAKKNISYHGFSLNTDMDLAPFNNIIPCGQDRVMTSISIEQPKFDCSLVPAILSKHIQHLVSA